MFKERLINALYHYHYHFIIREVLDRLRELRVFWQPDILSQIKYLLLLRLSTSRTNCNYRHLLWYG